MESPHCLIFYTYALLFYSRRLKLSQKATKTTRLALEVKEAIDSDPLCGPTSDRAKHFIGIEYEIVLERGLKNLG